MNLDQLIQGLTRQQIRELGERGVSAARVSDWKHGRRSPTTAQAKVLAIVTGEPFGPMAEEIAMREATPKQREFFRAMTPAAIAVLSVLVLFTLPSESQASARAAGTPSTGVSANQFIHSAINNTSHQQRGHAAMA